MGKCLGCEKRLGIFEGYSDFQGEYCKDCYPKREAILNKKENSHDDFKKEKSVNATKKTKLTKIQKEKFKEYLAMGKWNYVLTYGGRYAVFMFLGFWFFDKFILEEEFYVGLNMIIWVIAGLIIGLWGWSNINKKLREK